MGAGTNGLANGAAAAKGERAEDGTAVFRGTAYSPLRTTVALALWLGAIHFNAFLVLASLFLFPRRVAALYSPPPPLPPPRPPLDVSNSFFVGAAGCWPRSSSSCSCPSVTRADWAAGSPGSPPLLDRFASCCIFCPPWIAESEDARRICRFISRYVIGYFPVTLHVEDYDAFDPSRAYGELILTVSFPFLLVESSYLAFSVDS
jgi:hypothetical protein